MANPDGGFLFIGTYPSEAAARSDDHIVKDLHSAGAVGSYDAAVVTKDDAGKVHVYKDERTKGREACRQAARRRRQGRRQGRLGAAKDVN